MSELRKLVEKWRMVMPSVSEMRHKRQCAHELESLLSAPEAAPSEPTKEQWDWAREFFRFCPAPFTSFDYISALAEALASREAAPVEQFIPDGDRHNEAAPPAAEPCEVCGNRGEHKQGCSNVAGVPAEPPAGEGYFDPKDLMERWSQLFNHATFTSDPHSIPTRYVTLPTADFDHFNHDLPELMAERERKARLQEMIALPVHAWPDDGETYPQEWGAELVKYRNERIRALSTSAPTEGK